MNSLLGTRYLACGKGYEFLPDSNQGTVYSLKQLQEAVGGYIEVLPVHGQPNMIAVVNEEGRLRDLPVNPTASRIVGYEVVGDVAIIPRGGLE
jgi:hypothetical protein